MVERLGRPDVPDEPGAPKRRHQRDRQRRRDDSGENAPSDARSLTRAVESTAPGDALLDQAVADLLRWHEQQASGAGVAEYWRTPTDPAAPPGPADTADPADRRDWLQQPDRPLRLEQTRPYRQEGGLERPSSAHQQAVEEAVARGGGGTARPFTDPRLWMSRINDGGSAADPLRGNNCLDCSLAAMSTWFGEPVVSAPRFATYQRDGHPDESGESYGMHRAEKWLCHRYEFIGVGTTALEVLGNKLRDGGHGSAAHIVHTWPGGRTHAWNAFNYRGRIIWADPQHGVSGDRPVYRKVLRVWAIVMDAGGERL